MKRILVVLLSILSFSSCGKYIVSLVPVPGPQGPRGETGMSGTDGADGQKGDQGDAGQDGQNGHTSRLVILTSANGGGLSCPSGGVTILAGVDTDDNGLLDTSEVGSYADVCNGSDSTVSQFSPVGLIDPCGTASGIYNEVFLKLSSGTLLASFSDKANGQNTRLSVLTPGTYVTTDGDNCVFSVDGSGQVYGESHHY